jgi:Cdc6-like AAA superfamily ATPase
MGGLTEEQQKALKIALDRYHSGEQYTVISGWAGTGKTYLVKFIIAALQEQDGINPETDVCYCAYTGKACTVLQQRGNKNVKTLHKLLYKFFPKPNGTFFKTAVDYIEYKIIVVDEVSMADARLIEQLHKHKNIHIIYLGDNS